MMIVLVNPFGIITDYISSEVDTLFIIIFKKRNRDKTCCLWIAKHFWEFHTSVPKV